MLVVTVNKVAILLRMMQPDIAVTNWIDPDRRVGEANVETNCTIRNISGGSLFGRTESLGE